MQGAEAPLKAFEALLSSHKWLLCVKGCAQVHWKQERQEKNSLEARWAHWEWLLFPLEGHWWEPSPGCLAWQLGHLRGSPVLLGLFNSAGLHSPARFAFLKGEKAPHPSLSRRQLIHFFTTGKAFAVSRRECRKSNEIQKGAKWCFPLLDASTGSACCWHGPWWMKGDSCGMPLAISKASVHVYHSHCVTSLGIFFQSCWLHCRTDQPHLEALITESRNKLLFKRTIFFYSCLNQTSCCFP